MQQTNAMFQSLLSKVVSPLQPRARAARDGHDPNTSPSSSGSGSSRSLSASTSVPSASSSGSSADTPSPAVPNVAANVNESPVTLTPPQHAVERAKTDTMHSSKKVVEG